MAIYICTSLSLGRSLNAACELQLNRVDQSESVHNVLHLLRSSLDRIGAEPSHCSSDQGCMAHVACIDWRASVAECCDGRRSVGSTLPSIESRCRFIGRAFYSLSSFTKLWVSASSSFTPKYIWYTLLLIHYTCAWIVNNE